MKSTNIYNTITGIISVIGAWLHLPTATNLIKEFGEKRKNNISLKENLKITTYLPLEPNE